MTCERSDPVGWYERCGMTNTPGRPSAPSVGRTRVELDPGAHSPARTRATAVFPTPFEPVIMRCMLGRSVSVRARMRVVVLDPESVSGSVLGWLIASDVSTMFELVWESGLVSGKSGWGCWEVDACMGTQMSTSLSANVSPSPESAVGSGERLCRVERRV